MIIPLCLKFIPAELVDKSAQEENMARQKLLRAALEIIAAPRRPDGTFNRDRNACQRIAKDALGYD